MSQPMFPNVLRSPSLKKNGQFLLLLSLLFLLPSCANRMVPYDDEAYTNSLELKTVALNLMGLATQDYNAHKNEVATFKTKANEHISYEKDRGEKNQTTVDMWRVLMNPDGNLLGGFFTKWKNEGKLDAVLVSQFKNEVSKNFDKIVELENKKKK